MEQPKSGGMSKGCLIGLIVAGAILVLVIILMVTCYMNRDSLARFLTDKSLTTMKGDLRTMAGPGVDTTKFFALADAFASRMKTEPYSDLKFKDFAEAVKGYPKLVEDKVLDSTEVMEMAHAMISYFPDLDSMWMKGMPRDSMAAPVDTTAAKMQDTTATDTAAGR